MRPKVSVVMAVHNGARHLGLAVESILGQSYPDLEFITVDDGSTDGTPNILRDYADPRIVAIHNERNLGLAASLNKALTLAQGEYVARMDADDVALPHRLERQVAFLETHSDVGILGSRVYLIDADGCGLGVQDMPTSDLQIRWTSLISNPFLHPTVMLRRNLLREYNLRYDEDLQTSQDFDLWLRMLPHARGANLAEPLLLYRRGGGISHAQAETQRENHDLIVFRTIREYAPELAVTPEQASLLYRLLRSMPAPGLDRQWVSLLELYLNLLEVFSARHPGEPGLKALRRQVAYEALRVAIRSPRRRGWARAWGRVLRMDAGVVWEVVPGLVRRTRSRLRKQPHPVHPAALPGLFR